MAITPQTLGDLEEYQLSFLSTGLTYFSWLPQSVSFFHSLVRSFWSALTCQRFVTRRPLVAPHSKYSNRQGNKAQQRLATASKKLDAKNTSRIKSRSPVSLSSAHHIQNTATG